MLKKKSIAIAGVVIFLFFFWYLGTSNYSEITFSQYIILEETNECRRREGLEPLAFSFQLSNAAKIHAENMAKRRRLEHQLPIRLLSTVVERVEFVGYKDWRGVGENIARNHTEENVVDAWMDSPGHKANILGDFNEIGIGIAVNEDGEKYHCQVFGKRQFSPINHK